MKQACFLCHKTFHITQIRSIDLIHAGSGYGDTSLLHIPETHQKFQKRRFAAAAFPDDPNHTVFFNICGNIFENSLLSIGKGHMLCLCPVKCDFFLAVDLLYHRLFFQNIQYTVSGCKRILQGTAKICKCRDRAKRAHQSYRTDQYAIKSKSPSLIKHRRDKKHQKV